MTISLGLDIGSNSVGSAWVDTDRREIGLGVSVFPAGVDETETKRGTPKNQHRRQRRSGRRTLARRSERKRRLRALLTSRGLLPEDPCKLEELMRLNPWHLRRDGLKRPLTPHEFGRVMVHLNQRRGAWGVETDPEDKDEGKVKDAIDHTAKTMQDRNARTFGQLMADLMDEHQTPVPEKQDKFYQAKPIRNRQDSFQFHAARDLVRKEFHTLWERQRSFGGELSRLLTPALKRQFDDPSEDPTWRHKGVLFGQRRTYWSVGTLGRCELEPTDRCCPLADMHAQEFRVLETVNNIRLNGQPLSNRQREQVIRALRTQKTGSISTVRKALGIGKATLKKHDVPAAYHLNLEADPQREINTDWFYRGFVVGVFGEHCWANMQENQRESVNRAILKFDPQTDSHADRLREGAVGWWSLSAEAADKLVQAWKTRPKLEKRMNLSRRAILNLLPYMRDEGWTVTEARQRFAEDGDNNATPQQRERYRWGASILSKADRRYLAKHADPLPPAPVLANPVVRKAIHEVRRHVIEYIRKHGRKPDRIVVELAKQARQSEKVRNRILANNRKREQERKKIVQDFDLAGRTLNQQVTAVERVLLCRQQKGVCPYCGQFFTDKGAADGNDLEVDHIIPRSRSQDNFLSNKLLCHRACNRGKRNMTPKEWLSAEQFAALEQRMAHWRDDKGLKQKWENLHRDPEPLDQFINSQLTATAYAATQVGSYLRDALYAGEPDGHRRLFFTKGRYTAMLRKDWQLFQTLKPPRDDSQEELTAEQERPLAQKNRGDHRHHAIDAAVIALTGPEILNEVARLAAEAEEYHERTTYWPKRTPLPPPWGAVPEFRRAVLGQLFEVFDKGDADGLRAAGQEDGTPLIVSHRPVKRRLVGAFHEETAYGPVLGSDTLFTNRVRAENLTHNHLRVPEGRDALRARLSDPTLTKAQRRAVRRQLAALPDLPPAKSGIVRDRELRDHIRASLRDAGFDLDRLPRDKEDAKKLKEFVRQGRLQMPRSGIPINSVVLLRTNTDPIIIPRRTIDPNTGKETGDPDPRTARVYIGGNNHHIEIREDPMGRWTGKVVTTFQAAQRVRRDNKSPVDRSDINGQRFVMSLAEGETVHMSHRRSGQPDYFVVFKLDKPHTIHFIHHWDARPSKATAQMSAREDIPIRPNQLRSLEPVPGRPPYKVRVGPLGQVTRLERD